MSEPRKYQLDRSKAMPGHEMPREVKPPRAAAGEWDDDTKMPFGKYGPPPQGEGPLRVADVPLSYWAFLWNNGLYAETSKPAHKYIKKIVKRFDAEDVILEPDPRKV
jgi:hypothetical protein